MTKADIVDLIYETSDLSLKKKDIKLIVDELFEIIQEEIKNSKNENKIQISGFGTFFIKKRKAKVGRNPKTKEEKIIPERFGVSFKPGKGLLKELNNEKIGA